MIGFYKKWSKRNKLYNPMKIGQNNWENLIKHSEH